MEPLVKKVGLIKAKGRLADATENFVRFLGATTLATYTDAWSKFLISSAAVFNILEASARHTPQGRQWYGGVRAKGRKDALILYMRQARNAEEHGIDPVTDPEPIGIWVDFVEGANTINLKHIRPDDVGNPVKSLIRPEIWVENQPEITLKGPKRKLLPVTSREGDVFHPPSMHAGMPLPVGDAAEAGKAYLSYIQKLVAEAEGLN